jgi:isochorismate hydrolase
MSREDGLLVVIDMQEKLVSAMTQKARIVTNTKRLLALARTIDLPVVVTEQENLGPTVNEIAEDIPRFAPIRKICFNCFLCEPFATRIKETGRSSLIVCGIEAHICVAQTALWAYPDFSVHVMSDAISSRSIDNVSVGIERMRSLGVTISSTEMLIYELLQRGGTEEFRAMLPFVK